jgi:aryl-alcohol dehydrogenase-like predicted oxidoreductase
MSESNSRRDFLKTTGAVTAGLVASSVGGLNAQTASMAQMPENPRTQKAMPTRNLGKTGYRVGIFSLGGQAAIEQPNNADVAVPIVERAIELGVNYIDTAAMYGGGERWSQRYIVGMKIPARGRILSSWKPKTSHAWEGSDPKPGVLNMREAMYYTLSLPVSTVIIGCDSIAQLEENVKLAQEFTPYSEAQIAALTARTEPIAKQALFFRRWA